MSTNQRILIDNATLSGVERLTGVSQIANLSYIDNDIVCLEKLLTAILFSDQLIALDDYKDEYRSSRLKNFPFIDFVKPPGEIYSKIAIEAADFARSMSFGFEGSKPIGDVISFFDALRIDPQLRWNTFVLSEYLALSLLVKDTRHANYETSIDSAFRNECTDHDTVAPTTDHRPSFHVKGHDDIPDLEAFTRRISKANPLYKGMDLKSLERMVFGYGWVAERSYLYNAFAKEFDANAQLAPLRDAFCESCLRIDYPSETNSLIENLKKTTTRTISAILEPSGRAQFAVRLPFFVSYFISRSNNAQECIDLALNERHSPDFSAVRTIFHNFLHMQSGNTRQEINSIFKHLQQTCNNLMDKYSVSTANGPQYSLSLGLSGISIQGDFKINQIFRNYRHQPFSRLFRNIAQDLINVERMGRLHDKVCSGIRKHKDSGHASVALTPKSLEYRETENGRPAEL